MKTLAKFFLHFSLVILPYLTAGCTSEVEAIGGTPETPENPQANDPNRRSVVISLQNKLILVNGTPESRTTTRDGIAEEDENRIESFDIYAFGSDKEEGPYTFQERFAYRSDAGTLPTGASPIELKADEAAGKVNVVFYPRKGLFTKFYCVANQTEMDDATGHTYTNYTPLQQSSQSQSGMPGDIVMSPGTPTESDFIKLNTPLLNSTGFNADVLLAPLPMSGANSQPTDLREYSMGTYVRLNVSLTRAVARFDIVNDATKPHFTITDISMGNGRQGVTLFPIRPTGDIPATNGQLITYPYRLFDGLNANAGTTTKAFYCYPCKAVDAGFLILKGLYAMNLTDEKKEVSYRIPFERVTDGNGTHIEINHNHRYTVQITEADPFELTANIRLVDWETGDYIEDYEPDNGLETIAVADLLPVGETTYDINTNIVTLALKAGSSFTVSTGSNAGVETKLTYNGNSPADGWLKLEEIPVTTTRTGATQQVKYKISFNESYTGDSYPRGILRLTDKAGGSEEVILIDTTFGTPVVESTGGTMIPDGVNKWDTADNALYLVQVIGANTSTGVITITSIGGSKIVLPTNSDITVSPTSSVNTTQEYTFRWAGTDATDLTEKEITVALKNGSDETKAGNFKVKLLPNRLDNLQITNQSAGISLSAITATTATLTMPIIKDKQFTLTMDNYSKPTISKCPSWLENITPTSTRSTPESKTVSFTFKLIEDATSFDDTQIVFTNTAGGTGMTVNIAREFQVPTIEVVSTDPSVNSYISSSKSLNLYQLKSSYYSTATLKVYSLGGSTLQLPGGVETEFAESNAKEHNYVIKYKTSSFSLTDVNGGTLYVKNLSDNTKKEAITVTFKSSLPTFTANKSGITFTRATTDVDMELSTTDTALWGITNFTVTFKGITTYSYDESSTSSGAKGYQTVNQESKTSGTTTTFKFTFKNVTINETAKNLYYFVFKADDVKFPDYQIDEWTGTPVVYGMTTYKLNNYWIYSPQKQENWTTVNNSVPSGWAVPTMSLYKTFGGRSHSNFDNISWEDISFNTYQELVFAPWTELKRFWSSEQTSVGGARVLDIQIQGGRLRSMYGYPQKTDPNLYIYCKSL